MSNSALLMQSLFIARILLGVSIGNNSAAVPVYTAESVPPSIRGGLVMLWQTFTAFGIMLGCKCSIFLNYW
jgi:MFS family permease